MADDNSLGDRMKGYESITRYKIPKRSFVIIRLDGVAFHTYTRGFDKPFDERLIRAMNDAGVHVCSNIQNVRMAYIQSDEISLLLTDFEEDREQWYGGVIQKMASVSASRCSAGFNESILGFTSLSTKKLAEFDSRVFTLPNMDEVINYFIWRQNDWTRNSVQMLARSMYSQKELKGKNTSELHELIFQKGKNWNDLPIHLRRGRTCVKTTYERPNPFKPGEVAISSKWVIDNDIPIFTKDRDYIKWTEISGKEDLR